MLTPTSGVPPSRQDAGLPQTDTQARVTCRSGSHHPRVRGAAELPGSGLRASRTELGLQLAAMGHCSQL